MSESHSAFPFDRVVFLLGYATDKQMYKLVNNEEEVNGKLVLNHKGVFRPSYP